MAATPPHSTPTNPAADAGTKPIANKYAPPSSPLGRVPAPNGLSPRPVSKPVSKASRRRRGTPWLTFTAFVLTMVWFGVVGFYVIKAGGFTSFLESSGAAAVVAVTGLMMAPAALFWMVFAYIKRASDVESALEPLLRQLSLVTGQGGVAETRVRRFNDALAEQLTLLKETGSTSTRTAQSALSILTAERSSLEDSQSGFAQQINALVDTMRQQSAQLEALVEAGGLQMSNIASRALEAGATVASETHEAEQRLATLLDRVTGKFGATFAQLDREQQDMLNNYATLSNSVSETLKSDATEIEGRLSTLVDAIDETLDEVDRVAGDRLEAAQTTTAAIASREAALRAEAAAVSAELEESAASIEESVTRFRAAAAGSRTETDHALQSLSDQTRLLDSHSTAINDKLSTTRDQVAAAASALDQAASRLAASSDETGEALEVRIAGLDDAATALDATAQRIAGQLDRQLAGYGDKQTEVSTAYATLLDRLSREALQLTHAAEKLGADADNSAGRVRSAVDELAKTTSQSLESYGAIAGKADAQAAAVAENFNGAIDRYAGTARQLNVAAAELQQLAARCETTIAAMDTTLTERAGMLDAVGTRMATTSRTIKDDSAGLVVTLQDLSSRLETVRAAATEASDQTVLRLTDVATAAGRNLTGLEQLATGALARLESAGGEIGRQQSLIAHQVDAVQGKLATLGEELSVRIAGVLSQVEQSSQKANALVETALQGALSLTPALQSVAEEATSVALSASGAINAETQRFGDRLVSEQTRWQALTNEQSRAFADTIAELHAQMSALREVNAELEIGGSRATATLHSHTQAVGALDAQVAGSVTQATGQLDSVRGEIEKIVETLQRQALALGTVSQQALSDVREATETFGTEARTLGELSRQTESQIVSATERMGEARSATAATREDVYSLRAEIERVVEQLALQARQLDGAREGSRHAAEELAAEASAANTQLGGLTAGLETALERATTARAGAFVQLDDVAHRIAGETGVLAETIDALVARAGIAGEAIGAAGSAADRQLQAQLEETLTMLRAKLEVATQDIAQLASRAAEGAGIAASTLRGQVADQLAAIEAQTDATLSQIDIRTQNTSVIIGRAADSLTEAGDTVATQLDRALGQLGATDAALSQLASHAGTLRRSLVEDSETMISALDRVTQDLTSRIGLLHGTNEAGLDRAAQDTEALAALLATATARLEDSATQLRSVSQSAGGALTTIGAQLENQTDLVRETSAELAELSRDALGTETQLTDRLGALMTQVARTRGDLAALDLQLVDQSSRLASQQGEALATLSQTLTSLDQVSGRLVATGAEAVDSASAAQVHYIALAREAEQLVAQHAPAFAAAAERSAAALSDYSAGSEVVARRLEAQQQHLVGLYSALRSEGSASADTLAALADRITATELATSSATQAVLRQLGDASSTIVAGIGSVTGAADAAAQSLQLQAETLTGRAGQIGQAARSAASETEAAFAALQIGSAETQAALSGQLETLLRQVVQAQQGFDAAGAQLSLQSGAATQLLDHVGGKFEKMLDAARSTMLQLRQEMEGFTTATGSALDQSGAQLDERGQSFVEFGRRLETLVDSLNAGTGQALTQLRGVTQQLESARDSSTQLAEVAGSRLIEAASLFESRQDGIARSADHALVRLREATAEAGQAAETVARLEAHGLSLRDSLRAGFANGLDAEATALETALGRAQGALESAAQAFARHKAEALGASQDGAQVLAETARIIDSFGALRQQLDRQLQDLSQQLDSAVSQAGRQVTAFSILSDSQAELRAQTEKSVQSLSAAARRVAESSSDAKSDLETVADRYQRLQSLTEGALQNQLGELRQLIDGATSLMGDLGRQLETQTAAVTDAGSALAHVSGSVNDNTAAALSRLQTLNQRLEAAKLSATLATEEAARRVADILAQVDSDEELTGADVQRAS